MESAIVWGVMIVLGLIAVGIVLTGGRWDDRDMKDRD